MGSSTNYQLAETMKLIMVLAVVCLFLTLIFASFLPSSLVPQIQIALGIAAVGSLILQVVIYYGVMGIEEKQEAAFDYWNTVKKKWKLEVDPSFDLLEGEKIIAPITTCYIQAKSAYTWKHYARDVIVTNKRILIGFVTNVLLVRKETFGKFNIWNPNLTKIPVSTSLAFLGGNSKIRKLSNGTVNGNEFVKIELDYPLPNSITIFHPKSSEIYKIFRKQG